MILTDIDGITFHIDKDMIAEIHNHRTYREIVTIMGDHLLVREEVGHIGWLATEGMKMPDPIQNLIFKALLSIIDEDDINSAMAKSYGDFGRDLRKAHKNESSGSSEYHVECKNTHVIVELHDYGGTQYSYTWNKVAKAIHTYLHKRGGKI